MNRKVECLESHFPGVKKSLWNNPDWIERTGAGAFALTHCSGYPDIIRRWLPG